MLPSTPYRRRRAPFTLVEILVVLAIMGLVAGLVLPRIGRLPEGLRVDSCLGVFHNAFRDSALRSRATGATVRLVLDTARNEFRLEEVVPPVLPPAAVSANGGPPAAAPPPEGHYAGGKRYPLPNGIEWRLEGWDAAAGPPAYIFYPNGESAGPRLQFDTGRRRLCLEIDRLTANPLLAEAPVAHTSGGRHGE